MVFKVETEKAFANAIEGTTNTIHDYTVGIADNSSVLDQNAKSTKESGNRGRSFILTYI